VVLALRVGAGAHLAERLTQLRARHVELRRELAQRQGRLMRPVPRPLERAQPQQRRLDVVGLQAELVGKFGGEVAGRGPLVPELLERLREVVGVDAQRLCEPGGEACLALILERLQRRLYLLGRLAERLRKSGGKGRAHFRVLLLVVVTQCVVQRVGLHAQLLRQDRKAGRSEAALRAGVLPGGGGRGALAGLRADAVGDRREPHRPGEDDCSCLLVRISHDATLPAACRSGIRAA
jgi:hypothetical protein